MKSWIVSLLINTIALMVVAGYFEAFHVESIGAALLASVLLSLFNVFLKPILVLLTLPVTIFSLGLFLIVINAALLSLTAELMGDSFNIDGFSMALLAAVIISLLNMFLTNFILEPLKKNKKKRR
ncbi:phage holin family protein [Fictibacillus phosphorivorans]|uniref:phage holin family protein n=1 Tax=Fictibacillus phosphorivorans TaxID=1221500 RepID=UPI00203F079C|nr:phage holin family protein [Fictibacillus phosphorivorans]MCM3718287.1 phage holin family protein [Fictibacillus phosphorivorans]MCM3775849.1 phage holin family protein [Fictibacillus phosphorivorans]